MYNAALVMAEQLKAVGIKAELKVVDWPTSVQHGAEARYRAGTSSLPAGARSPRSARSRRCSLHGAADIANYMPKDGKDDPDLLGRVERHEQPADPKDRQAAFARMQKLILEKVLRRSRSAR